MESISDYTEVQFIRFVQELLDAHGSGITEEALDERIHYFCELIEHPDGSNLIYYPEPGADTSAEGITRTIKEWREANGLPGFKPRF